MSDLFSSTYNPDVLSCLANLSNDEVFTPPEVVNQMLDLLPEEIWHDRTVTFLDPACKTGVFLREIAKRLIRAQLPDYESRSYEISEKTRAGIELDEEDIAFQTALDEVCDHVFKKQLYGIAITELTSLLSRRSVYCSKYPQCEYSIVRFNNPEGNIDYKQMDHTWEKGEKAKCIYCGASKAEYNRGSTKESYAYEFIHLDNPEEVFNMKFDVIIGNPPYQMSDGGNKNSASPIYQLFIEKAKLLKPRYISMITPSRWLAGGKGLDGFRSEMFSDGRIRKMVDYVNAKDCFPQNSVSGGVNYFLWDRDNQGECEITTVLGGVKTTRKRRMNEFGCFIRFNTAVEIVRKIKSTKLPSLSTLVLSRNPFGYPTSERGKEVFRNGDYRIVSSKGVGYVDPSSLTKSYELVDSYKVIVSRIVYEHAGEPDKEGKLRVLSKIRVLGPYEVCTDSYLAIGPFDTEVEASNLSRFLATKFTRFLIAQTLSSINLSKEKFAFVPKVDFHAQINDEKLYQMFHLTQDEISFIEETMHPLELDD